MFRCVIFIILFNLVYNYKLSNKIDNYSDPKSDVTLSSFQLINKYGYNAERHQVPTEDGYLSTLFRLENKGPPVLLVHGIADSSDSWLVLGPKNSLAYQLADAGFDVWLYNARGNKYSRDNPNNFSEKDYWSFTFEEMGRQDVPAVIDYILEKTSNKKITYVGYSQGTTILFVMCSLRPEYNDKINHAVLLAPVAWVTRITHPLIKIVSVDINRLLKLFENLGLYEIFNEKLRKGINCTNSFAEEIYCNVEYYLNFGLRSIKNLAPDKIDVIDSHIPAGASAKTFAHFIQGYKNQQFQRYDYGLLKNVLTYSTFRPPAYDLSLMRVPVSIISSDVDWLSDKTDVRILINKLPNVKRFTALNRTLDFSHMEFVYGSRVKSLINDPIFNIIKTELNNTIL